MHPILDRTRSVAEQSGDLRTGQALRHKQDAMQAVTGGRVKAGDALYFPGDTRRP